MPLLLNCDALEALSTPTLEQLRIALKQILCAPWLTDADRAALQDALGLICIIVQRRPAVIPSP